MKKTLSKHELLEIEGRLEAANPYEWIVNDGCEVVFFPFPGRGYLPIDCDLSTLAGDQNPTWYPHIPTLNFIANSKRDVAKLLDSNWQLMEELKELKEDYEYLKGDIIRAEEHKGAALGRIIDLESRLQKAALMLLEKEKNDDQ